MQTLDCYYYHNSVEVQLNSDPTLNLRNRVMYQRTLKIYKGIDNVVRFTFKNSDQKPVNITGWVVTFNLLSDEIGAVIVSKTGTPIDLIKGIITFTLDELDLIDLDNEFYNYSLSVTDPNGSEQVVYADDNYTARGLVQVLSGHYPEFRSSVIVSLPASSNNVVTSSAVTSNTKARMKSPHHTAQFNFNDFTGNVDVQGTLDSLPANGATGGNTSVSWATVSSLGYANQTVPDYCNWEGVFTAVRFVVTPQPDLTGNIGSVTEIYYRP